MCVPAKSSYSKGTFNRGSPLRCAVCEILNLMNICLHVWFWWTGLDKMRPTPRGTYLMIYVVKTDLFGWARKVMIAMSLCVLRYTVYWISVEFLQPWRLWSSRAKEEFTAAVTLWQQQQDKGDELDGNLRMKSLGIMDATYIPEERILHDGCSRYSCLHCSPWKSEFSLRYPDLQQSEAHTQAEEISRHDMQLLTCKTMSPSRSTSPSAQWAFSLRLRTSPRAQLGRRLYQAGRKCHWHLRYFSTHHQPQRRSGWESIMLFSTYWYISLSNFN